MSYILTLKDHPEGVFSVVDRETGSHVIPIFENADDVARYHNQIEEGRENPPLTVVEVQTDTIVSACRERNQKCVIITVDDFMIPPIEA